MCWTGPGNAQEYRAEPETGASRQSEPAHARNFMVAAAHPLAVRAGLDILRKGGSALDAAIAVQMVLNVVEPQSSGIGGGGFLLYWDADQHKLFTYDGRETAPAAARPDRFLAVDGEPIPWPQAVGTPLAVGVPGVLAMLAMAHSDHGKLPWNTLFDGAIRYARDGFGVSPRLNTLLARRGAKSFSPAARALFFDERDEPWPLGHVLRNPELAATFEAIARNGAPAFYSGSIADDILRALAEAPGPPSEMVKTDLAGYAARRRPPVCAPYRAYVVCGMGPPSSGGLTVAQILTMLEGFDLGEKPSGAAIHLVAEAEKLAYADRNRYMADEEFVDVPSGLTDPGYLRERARAIKPGRSMPAATPGFPPARSKGNPGRDATIERPGTTHISIVDANGNAVSFTSSIETAFGSGIMVRGFLLNNQLTDFSFRPTDADGATIANRPQAGKRPRSSMAPTMSFAPEGTLHAVLGSPGGSRIILYVIKALVAMIDWKMDPQQAAFLPAFGSRNGPLELEQDPRADWLADPLAQFGQNVVRPAMTSGLNIIAAGNDGLLGASDPRREGIAQGD